MKMLYSESDNLRPVDERSATSTFRTEFRRDYSRIVHSRAFRRLQRKTQLFPFEESDYFRNRLTHSLEVAQIAKSIAIKFNSEIRENYGDENQIDLDLIEFAALSHDLGHPPFGHTGEEKLDELCRSTGGFEGNAQTLRILARLERKVVDNGEGAEIDLDTNQDHRAGINPTFRSLASILKYDEVIKKGGARTQVQKGYYDSESELIESTKKHVIGEDHGNLRTVEMQIMDVADDIAYSTYDLEDSFKGNFTSLARIHSAMRSGSPYLQTAAVKIFESDNKRPPTKGNAEDDESLKQLEQRITDSLTTWMSETVDGMFDDVYSQVSKTDLTEEIDRAKVTALAFSADFFDISERICANGYLRQVFTSKMIDSSINTLELKFNEECPALSEVRFADEDRKILIETLKHLNYEMIISSPKMQLTQELGREVINCLYVRLREDKHGILVPDDWKARWALHFESGDHDRVVADYISGMTDSYALKLHQRIKTGSNGDMLHMY